MAGSQGLLVASLSCLEESTTSFPDPASCLDTYVLHFQTRQEGCQAFLEVIFTGPGLQTPMAGNLCQFIQAIPNRRFDSHSHAEKEFWLPAQWPSGDE